MKKLLNFLGLNVARFYNKNVQSRVIGNEMGFSLVDLLVASMMSVIIVSICYSVMAFQYSQLRAVRALYVQNILLANIKSAASAVNLKEVSKAEPVNTFLRACLNGVDGAVCASTVPYDLRLMDGGPVSGFRGSPVGYNLDAQRCDIGTPNCIFKVETYFRVQCPDDDDKSLGPTETCPGISPSLIEVFYDFGTVEDTGPNRVLGAIPTMTGSVIVKL